MRRPPPSLSLDVQGAELKALQATRPSAFALVMTEVYGLKRTRIEVDGRLVNANIVRYRNMSVFGSWLCTAKRRGGARAKVA